MPVMKKNDSDLIQEINLQLRTYVENESRRWCVSVHVNKCQNVNQVPFSRSSKWQSEKKYYASRLENVTATSTQNVLHFSWVAL